jgi:hypothetical protein
LTRADAEVVARYLIDDERIAGAYVDSMRFHRLQVDDVEHATGVDILATGGTSNGAVLVRVAEGTFSRVAEQEIRAGFLEREVMIEEAKPFVPWTAIVGGDSLGTVSLGEICTKGYTMSRPWTNGGKLFYALTAGHCDQLYFPPRTNEHLRHGNHNPVFTNADNTNHCLAPFWADSNADSMVTFLGGTTSSSQPWPTAAKNTKVKWRNAYGDLVQLPISTIDDAETFPPGSPYYSSYGVGPALTHGVPGGWNGIFYGWLTLDNYGGPGTGCDLFFTRALVLTSGIGCAGDSGAPPFTVAISAATCLQWGS